MVVKVSVLRYKTKYWKKVIRTIRETILYNVVILYSIKGVYNLKL